MQERWKRSGYSKSKVHLSLYNIFLNPQLLWVRFLRLFSDSWSRYFFILYLTITLARFLNRVDEIIVFRRLDEGDMLAITYRLLDEVEKRFESLGLRLVVPEDAARRLAGMGRSENSGARPLRRTIRREIVDRAAQLLLEGALRPGDVVTAVCEGDGIELRKG